MPVFEGLLQFSLKVTLMSLRFKALYGAVGVLFPTRFADQVALQGRLDFGCSQLSGFDSHRLLVPQVMLPSRAQHPRRYYHQNTCNTTKAQESWDVRPMSSSLHIVKAIDQ